MKRVLLAVVAFSLATASFAQGDASPQTLALERLMSFQEFRNAGLHKLSADELAALNAWLTRYTLQIASTKSHTGLTGKWLALDSNTVRVLRDDGSNVYAEALTRDEKESIGNFDLTRGADGTISGSAKLQWSCRFMCHDISCDVPRWIENTCVLEEQVVFTSVSDRRIEGYVVAPKIPDSLDRAYPTFCRKCGTTSPKLKQTFVWVRIE